MNKEKIKQRLAYLREQIEQENISYGEIAELQGLKDYIDPSDTLLLQWAGIKADYRKELKIEIFYSELNDGWIYNIYDKNSKNEQDSGDSLDGGLCSTTMENALEMAYEMAKNYTI